LTVGSLHPTPPKPTVRRALTVATRFKLFPGKSRKIEKRILRYQFEFRLGIFFGHYVVLTLLYPNDNVPFCAH